MLTCQVLIFQPLLYVARLLRLHFDHKNLGKSIAVMQINSLLNPEPEGTLDRHFSLTKRRPERYQQSSPMSDNDESMVSTKIKIGKDSAKFNRGSASGEIKFPPYSPNSLHLEQQFDRFEIYPRRNIQEFPRHIPYSSDKKGFQAKTGRDSFEGKLSTQIIFCRWLTTSA